MLETVVLQSGELLATGGVVVVAIILFLVLWLTQKYEQQLARE